MPSSISAGGREGEREARGFVPAAVEEEVGALDEGDALVRRLGQQRSPRTPGGKIEPEEVPAFGAAPGSRPHPARARARRHGVPADAQRLAHALEVRLVAPMRNELEQRGLDEDGRRDVVLEHERLDLGDELCGEDQVAGADPRRNGLRERREEDDALAVRDLERRGSCSPSKRSSP